MKELRDFISNALVFRDNLHKALNDPLYYRWVFLGLRELFESAFVIAIGDPDSDEVKKSEYTLYEGDRQIRFLSNFFSETEPFRIVGDTVLIDRKFDYDQQTRSNLQQELQNIGLNIDQDRLRKIISRKLQRRQPIYELYQKTKYTIKNNKLIFKPKHDQALKDLLTFADAFTFNHPDRWQIDKMKLFEIINPCLEIIFRVLDNNPHFKTYIQSKERSTSFRSYSRKMIGQVKHDLNIFYKILWEISIIEKFGEGKIEYETKNPPQPDFLINREYYMEVTSATYNQNLAKQIHLLNKCELSAREFNAAHVQLKDPDKQLETFLFNKIEDKKGKYYRTYNKSVSLLVYISAPITDLQTITSMVKEKQGFDKGHFEHIWLITPDNCSEKSYRVWEL